MLHVMIASESRRLLKEVDGYLRYMSDFIVHLVPYSTNIIEGLNETNSDILILDAEILLPFQTILQQLKRSQHCCRVILLTERNDVASMDESIMILQKQSLSGECLLNAIAALSSTNQQKEMQHLISLAWNGMEYLPQAPDSYFIMLARYVGQLPYSPDPTLLGRLQIALSRYGESHIKLNGQGDMMCVLQQSKTSAGFTCELICKSCMHVLGSEYAAFYISRLAWPDLQMGFSKIVQATSLAFFFRNEYFDVNQMRRNKIEPNYGSIYHSCGQILKAVLQDDAKQVLHSCRELYLRRLKVNSDYTLVRYARFLNRLLGSFLSSAAALPCSEIVGSFANIEEEQRYFEEFYLHFCVSMQNKKISNVVLEAALFLYQNFSAELSLDVVATEIGINKTYLGRLFKEQTGITCLDFLQMLRIEQAYFFVCTTSAKIADIALGVGYKDASYFSRVFKQQFKLSPDALRHQERSARGGCDESIF